MFSMKYFVLFIRGLFELVYFLYKNVQSTHWKLMRKKREHFYDGFHMTIVTGKLAIYILYNISCAVISTAVHKMSHIV